MSEQLDLLAELAQGYVRAGEEVIAVANVNYGGKVNLEAPLTGIASLNAGQSNVAQGSDMAERMGDHPDVTFPIAKSMGLVLTGARLMVWSRGGFKAKYKDYIGEVPVDAIERASVEEGRLTDHLQIKLSSGWEVNLDANRNEGGAALGAELLALIDDRREPGQQYF
jgi:hypothetical protein